MRGGDEAAADADQAAALGRHRHARARRGAARAHRLAPPSRRPASWARPWSPSSWPAPTARSSAATTSTTCSRRSRGTRSASGGGGAEAGPRLHRLHGRGQVARGARGRRGARRARRRRRRAAGGQARRADRGVLRRATARRPSAPPRRSWPARCSRRADGGVIALGGGALGSERVRAALARHLAVLLDVDLDTAWARAHAQRAPAGARPRRLRGPLHARAGRSTRRPPTPSCRRPARGVVARALDALQAIPEGHRLLWAHERVGRLPGLGRAAGARAVAGGRAAARRQRRDRRRAARARASPTPPGVVEIPPGEEHKTLADGRARLARAGRRRAPPAPTTSSRSAAASSATSPASARPPTSAASRVVQVPTTLVAQVDSAYGGKTGRRPARGQELRRRLPPARGRARPTRRLLQTLPPAELAAGYAEVVKTALIAGGPLWDRVAGGRRRRRRRDRRLRAHEAARRRRRRARRRRAPGAQPRPHGRPRDRDRHRLRALPPRRGGRPRAARRAAPLRPGRAARARRGAARRAPGCRRALEGVDAAAVAAATRARQEAHRRGRRPRAGRGARPRDAPATRSGAAELLAAVRELSGR